MTVFGPALVSFDIEDAVRDTLRTWIHDYLGEHERHSPYWALGQIQRPRSWQLVSDYRDPKADRQLPCIAVESAEEESLPAAGGMVDGEWGFNVTVIAKDNDRDGTRRVVSAYVGAIKRILWQKGSLGGLAADVTVGSVSYDAVNAAKAKTVAGATIRIVVTVPEVASRWGGPNEPTPPVDPPPPTSPTDPLHTSTNVNVSAELP